jgi:hypothetical protein
MARPCNGLLDRIEPDGLEENIGAGSSSTDHRVTAPGGRSANGRARTIIETNARDERHTFLAVRGIHATTLRPTKPPPNL